MTREQAFQLLTKYLQNKNLIKHSLAAEAGMRGIYKHLHGSNNKPETEEVWGITGLLHDIDYEIAQKENKLDKHGTLIFEREPNIISQEIEHAIRAHNYENTNTQPENDMDWAIAIVDGLTGFIVACALVRPDKKLESVTTDFVAKKLKEKEFAKNVRRGVIQLCETKLDIPLETFITITLKSMQEIHTDLGL